MTTYQHHNETVVRRIRIKGRGLDPLLARLRLDNLLQTVELHPAWLPPSAIVCLRQVRDPLPRALQLKSHSPQRETQLIAWRQALSTTVLEESKRAVRPIKGQVSQDATAVIFNDQSELLACLGMDWLDQRLGSHWWWRCLIKRQDLSGIVPRAWSDSAEYVPAAIELLAANRRLESFALALSPDQTKELLRQVTRSFALHQLQSALDESFKSTNTVFVRDRVKARPLNRAAVDSDTVSDALPKAPWSAYVPESFVQSLEIAHQCLIGVALTIRRAPGAACSSRFARATLDWLKVATHIRFDSITHSVASPGVHDARNLHVTNEPHPLTPSTRTINGVARENSLTEELEEATTTDAEKEQTLQAYKYPEPKRASSFLRDAQVTREPETASEVSNPVAEPAFERSSTSLPHEVSSDVARDPLARDEIQVETEFGGIFYLINVGLFLELYSDFTRPHGKNVALPIFDFIELIGRRLLKERITADPVWRLLAQLSGRSEFDSPGHRFEPPDEWHVPVQWLEAFPEDCRLEWMTEGERLRVKHPAGFLLFDVPLFNRPARQLKREMVVYNASAKRQLVRKSFSFFRSRNSLEQWLDWIVPYVRARLCRAFGIDDASALGKLLCAQRASILSTPVHLDIFFELSEHPLEIRLAGLDRDPGWVPQAGRFIKFRYQ